MKTTMIACLSILLCLAVPVQGDVSPSGSTQDLRIVSLNGSNTEVLFALGAGDKMVGRDISASYPPEAEQLPSFGYQYQLNAEGILSLKPNLIIGRSDAKPQTVLQQLRGAGVKLELIDEPTDFAEAGERIRTVGKLVGESARAEELVSELERDVETFKKRKEELSGEKPPKALFIYMRGSTTCNVLGTETNPGRMIELVGAENAMPSVERTAPVTPEALLVAQPEVIVVFKNGLESVGGVDEMLKIPGLAHTPAGKARRIVVMDDQYLGGFTDRMGKAALDLLNGLHGEGIVVVESR